MKKSATFFFILFFSITISQAQIIALDFTKTDCYGKTHHLYSELDSDNVVIMEFFHTCHPCIAAATDMKPMFENLVAKYGNKVRFYVAPEDDEESCTGVVNWVNSNGFSSIAVPFDSGGAQSSYYGQGGMPTIAVAAGNSHKLLYLASSNTASGFVATDTALISAAIRNFFELTGIQDINLAISTSIFPNPVASNFIITLQVKEVGRLKLDLTDINGRKITELMEENLRAGNYEKTITVNNIPGGIYFIKGIFNESVVTKKIVIQ